MTFPANLSAPHILDPRSAGWKPLVLRLAAIDGLDRHLGFPSAVLSLASPESRWPKA